VFTQLFDRRDKVLLTRLSGTFGQADITGLYASVQRMVDREGTALRSIQDFGGVDAVDVDLGRIAQHGWRRQILPGRQRVLVVPQAEYQHIARMFVAYQKFAEFDEPQIVRSIDEAYALLDLKDPQFEPIE
jgi:hypothetical protein